LLGPIRRDEGGKRDQASIALRQTRPLPEVAVHDVVGVLHQRGNERLNAVALGGWWGFSHELLFLSLVGTGQHVTSYTPGAVARQRCGRIVRIVEHWHIRNPGKA
jgi:hypothetical protein